jgi:flagellin
MSLVVNHNLMAMNAARNLSTIYSRLSKSTQRLSSGLRINSAADDAAGLAIREQMRADIAVLNQGLRNAADGISMIQTAEGALSVIDEKLTRMKELAEQASTGTYTTAQRDIMNSEYQAMAAEIDRIANATDFNGIKLLDGSISNLHGGDGLKIHFGTGNDSDEDYYFIDMGDMRATEATGLRVGNSDPREYWRTTYLDAPTATSYLGDSARGADSTSDGVFGIQYSTELDANNNPVWQMYGYVPVDANRDSVTSLVDKISRGAQARGTFSFAGATSTELVATRLTVNGQVYAFDDTVSTLNYNGPLAISTVGIDTLATATSLATSFAAILNRNYASTGVFAAVNGTTVQMFSTEFGEVGNEIQIVTDTTSVVRSAPTLRGGGEKVLTADAWWDEINQQFELQISMDVGGDDHQMRLFSLTSISGAGDVIDSNATVGYLGSLTTSFSGIGVVSNFPGTDEDEEWVEAQNGSGNTDWDGADIRTQSAAQLALGALESAINRKDIRRAELGAFANRLENTITNLQIQAENLQAAESRISDVDVALEMTEFTRNNILAQAATAMLAQANSLPQLALQLLGG